MNEGKVGDSMKNIKTSIMISLYCFIFLLAGCNSVEKHDINTDEWIKTPYIALDYSEYLGVHNITENYGNKRFDFYGIKDLDEKEWLYGSTYMLYDPDSAVYKNKSVSEEPLYDWEIEYIGISTEKKEEKHNRYIYKIGKVTDDKALIQAILDAFRLNPETKGNASELVSHSELFIIFKDHSSLSYSFSIRKYEDGSIYLTAKNTGSDFNTNPENESFKVDDKDYDLINSLIEKLK